MVERTPEEESIDWTKIEPGVNFLKSPKGMCAYSPALLGSRRTLWFCPVLLCCGWLWGTALAMLWALTSEAGAWVRLALVSL